MHSMFSNICIFRLMILTYLLSYPNSRDAIASKNKLMIPSFFYFDYVENKLVSSTMQHYFSFILFTFYQSTNKCCKHSQKSYQVSRYRLLNQKVQCNACFRLLFVSNNGIEYHQIICEAS